jgi:FSR family fosmidomycin resistance protein-like MFS transporter
MLALLIATLAFSTSLTQPVLGALADRLGRRAVGGIGVIVSAALVSLLGVAPSVGLLFGLLLVGGLGSGAFHPAGASMARASGARNVELAVSLFGAGGTLGLALGPVLALSLVAAFGLGFTPWLMIPGVLVGALLLLVVPPQERTAPADRRLLDWRLVRGPVGLLTLSELASSIAFVTFSSAAPLWLVSRGVARDSLLIGWTLAAFSASAAGGGILAAALSARVSRRLLVSGSMLVAPLPLFAVFFLEPGTPLFFLAVVLAGALVNAGFPLKVVSAQELAPRSVAAASGLLMGFTSGTAGVLYIGVGRLQETIGLAAAMGLSYLGLLPGAILAYAVMARRDTAKQASNPVGALALRSCRCSG